jgi:hypothetical protein
MTWNLDPPIGASHIAGMTGVCDHARIVCEIGARVGVGGILTHFLSQLASNHISPNLYLLSSWDYRYESLCPADLCFKSYSELMDEQVEAPGQWQAVTQTGRHPVPCGSGNPAREKVSILHLKEK